MKTPADQAPRSRIDQALASGERIADPYPIYAELQRHAPAEWSETLGGWVVTRHADVQAVLGDHETYSNEGRQNALLERLSASSGQGYDALERHYREGGIINSDPPVHTRLRTLVSRAFSKRSVVTLVPRIEALVDELLAARPDPGSWDLMADLAAPLPAIVIAELLGAPSADRTEFTAWSASINTFLHIPVADPAAAARAQEAVAAMSAYLDHLLSERRGDPRPGLLTALAQVDSDGSRLTHSEVLATAITLLIAGHETTTNLIGNATFALLRDVEQRRWLEEAGRVDDDAVEELMRYDSSVQAVKRIVKRDHRLHGVALRGGQLLFAVTAAANRDESVYADAQKLNLRRDRRQDRHLGFGHGIHFCLGAPLARLEVACVLSRLFGSSGASELTLEEPPTWKPTFALRGPASLRLSDRLRP